jgi:ligand-binding sensor domain-containing protein
MYKVLKTFVFFLISCSVVAQNNNLHFRHLTVDDGLPHTDATQVLQDKQGFIWISTYSGLTRFDGYEIKNFVSKNYKFQNVYLNRINKLFYDNDKIWLATQGGIAYFDIEKEEIFIPHFEKKVENNFSSVCIYKNQIFGLSNGKLYIFEQYDNLFKPLKIPENLPFINFIQISKEGELFLGTTDGLYSYRKNIYKKYALFTNNTPLKSLSFVGFDSSDNLVLGSNQFLSFVSIKNLKKQDLEVDTYNFNLLPNELEDFKNQNINSVVQDLKGDYWISTPIGLLKFDLKSKEFNIPKQSSSLSTKYTNNLLIDKSGSLWVSTFGGGVNFIDLTPKLFNTLRFEDQNSNYVRAIYEEDNTGNLWIGTRTEGLIY